MALFKDRGRCWGNRHLWSCSSRRPRYPLCL